MGTVKKIGRIVISVILWIVILLAALYAFVTLATKSSTNLGNFLGFTPMSVQSDSMAPTFKKGDLILIKQTDPETLEVGDIVTFHTIIENEYVFNTHRITEITEEDGMRQYTTKGDNNALEDSMIIKDADIAGKYVGHVPVLGYVVDFLSNTWGFLIVIVLPMLLFFIYQIYHLIMVMMELKKANALEAAVEEEKARLAVAEAMKKEGGEAGSGDGGKPEGEGDGGTPKPDGAEGVPAEAAAAQAEAESAKAEAEAAKEAAQAEAESAKAEAEAVKEAAQAEAENAKAEAEAAKEAAKAEADEAERMKAEAQKALEEAKRLQEEAAAALARLKAMQQGTQEASAETAAAEEKPAATEEKPAAAEEKPAATEEKPAAAEEKPAATE